MSTRLGYSGVIESLPAVCQTWVQFPVLNRKQEKQVPNPNPCYFLPSALWLLNLLPLSIYVFAFCFSNVFLCLQFICICFLFFLCYICVCVCLSVYFNLFCFESRSCCLAKAGLELVTHLPLALVCRDYQHATTVSGPISHSWDLRMSLVSLLSSASGSAW